jgi:hypothetical protein
MCVCGYIYINMLVMFSMVATMTGDGTWVTNNDPERKYRSRKGKVYESPWSEQII